MIALMRLHSGSIEETDNICTVRITVIVTVEDFRLTPKNLEALGRYLSNVFCGMKDCAVLRDVYTLCTSSQQLPLYGPFG